VDRVGAGAVALETPTRVREADGAGRREVVIRRRSPSASSLSGWRSRRRR
jgi:hypothetical protein